MDDRRKAYWALISSFVLLVSACYGPDLENEQFNCFGDEDCAAGYQCRRVGDQQVCLEDDSDDVRLCETYCDQFLAKCETLDSNPFDSRQTCLDRCDAIPATGEMGDTTGDTIQCRFYHIGVAQQADTTHCPHAFPLAAAGGCTGECFDFCSEYHSACGGFNADSPSESDLRECRTACQEYQRIPAGELADPPESNTLECRLFYLDAAEDDPDEFCVDAKSAAGEGGRCQ